jgi:hypothetical protein
LARLRVVLTAWLTSRQRSSAVGPKYVWSLAWMRRLATVQSLAADGMLGRDEPCQRPATAASCALVRAVAVAVAMS